jgi:hypothetical protein
MVVLLEWLFGQMERREAAEGRGGRALVLALVLVAGVFGEGVDAAGRDREATRAVLARREQPGDGLDAGADGVVGGQRAAGQLSFDEGAVERGDVLGLVGAAAPEADLVAAGEVEQGGDDDGVERGAALIIFVDLPGALVLVDAKDGCGA